MNRPTILHVEDDPNDVVLLDHACRKAGIDCEIKRVADGEEAIAYLMGKDEFADRGQFPLPQLILLDLKMPHLSGFDVLQWRRENDKIRTVPVVVLSSSNHDLDLVRAYELGVNSYLIKPVSFDSLVSIVKALSDYWLRLNTPAGA
jgi:DNA-binding response OmpR family regulator